MLGVLVFFMQAGFTLLEAGAVRRKNALNIVMKNLIDVGVGAIGWWVLGYALAFGETYDDLFGNPLKSGPFLMHRDMRTQLDGSQLYDFWFSQSARLTALLLIVLDFVKCRRIVLLCVSPENFWLRVPP